MPATHDTATYAAATRADIERALALTLREEPDPSEVAAALISALYLLEGVSARLDD